ncbi:unnamed protein product [Anisakis simplex]|uniref:Secreted protein n=1 Tax=Anisakis simplex TaxID=6269 RepID=A0A0M3J5B2_ANISI|nr:unnamed protein product [Anisakis simplex]
MQGSSSSGSDTAGQCACGSYGRCTPLRLMHTPKHLCSLRLILATQLSSSGIWSGSGQLTVKDSLEATLRVGVCRCTVKMMNRRIEKPREYYQ